MAPQRRAKTEAKESMEAAAAKRVSRTKPAKQATKQQKSSFNRMTIKDLQAVLKLNNVSFGEEMKKADLQELAEKSSATASVWTELPRPAKATKGSSKSAEKTTEAETGTQGSQTKVAKSPSKSPKK
eukprot:Rmarinus@m.28887